MAWGLFNLLFIVYAYTISRENVTQTAYVTYHNYSPEDSFNGAINCFWYNNINLLKTTT